MTEVKFARDFLSQLESRPMKLPLDYVSDARQLELDFPYILPKMPNAKRKSKAPDLQSKRDILLKSMRNPALELRLSSIDPASTTVYELKERVSRHLRLSDTGKVKILWERKPISDTRLVKDLQPLGNLPDTVELAVMVVGYKDPPGSTTQIEEPPTATKAVEMERDEFWTDLRGFLQQRLKDEALASAATQCFQRAWQDL